MHHRTRLRSVLLPAPALLLACLAACSATGAEAPTADLREAAGPEPRPSAALPYVYDRWEQLTTADGLPDDHVFAVKVHEGKVWIGTEGGLACLDKRSGEMRSWTEDDGLPWRVISSIDVHPGTGDVWIGLFGGGLARYSAGRFDHWHQLNSGIVNDVVYGVCVQDDNVWVATTAGASRLDTLTGEWTIFNEKNAPMEEIWNYSCCYADGLVYLAVWGSGALEYDVARGTWKEYLDPDREMEIDLYRDDGIVHVITTMVSYVEQALWVSTYFGACRYDGRNWRGFYAHESGLPSDFCNAITGRSASEAWISTDKGLGVLADFESDTWVTYTNDHAAGVGRAVVQRGAEVLAEYETGPSLPHNHVLNVDFDGDDVWVATAKGLGRAIGAGYFPGLRTAAEQVTSGHTRGKR